MNISVEFKKLIAFEINRSTNLHDLIYMTDRGQYPMKPWTASKTFGTIALLKNTILLVVLLWYSSLMLPTKLI